MGILEPPTVIPMKDCCRGGNFPSLGFWVLGAFRGSSWVLSLGCPVVPLFPFLGFGSLINPSKQKRVPRCNPRLLGNFRVTRTLSKDITIVTVLALLPEAFCGFGILGLGFRVFLPQPFSSLFLKKSPANLATEVLGHLLYCGTAMPHLTQTSQAFTGPLHRKACGTNTTRQDMSQTCALLDAGLVAQLEQRLRLSGT